jgi:hypothetical protein
MARTKCYVSEEGCYLAIDERNDGIYIAWYTPEDGDFGGYIEEGAEMSDIPPEKGEDWIVYKTVKALADDNNNQGFVFDTMKKAKIALAACNDALLNMDKP